jgi:hypothetical protein
LDLANYRGTSDRVDSYNNNSPEFLCSYWIPHVIRYRVLCHIVHHL